MYMDIHVYPAFNTFMYMVIHVYPAFNAVNIKQCT